MQELLELKEKADFLTAYLKSDPNPVVEVIENTIRVTFPFSAAPHNPKHYRDVVISFLTQAIRESNKHITSTFINLVMKELSRLAEEKEEEVQEMLRSLKEFKKPNTPSPTPQDDPFSVKPTASSTIRKPR